MIQYPVLIKGTTIGVTAPSSGVREEHHDMVKQACERLRKEGYDTIVGPTVWTQDKARSSPAHRRAAEWENMMNDPKIGLIIPPWGGELLIEILEHLDFDRAQPKWILGYSDISLLLLAMTLRTGIATAHGTNLIDLRGEHSDETTAMWQTVLSAQRGQSVLQRSSSKFQKQWRHTSPSSYVFHLTEPTCWKSVSPGPVRLTGRLLGGCIDVIRHLIGTPYGDVAGFQDRHIQGEPILWYLENCELSVPDLRRSLVHMKLAGWFDRCCGIVFGRSSAPSETDGYTMRDVYAELSEELGVPVVYDIDCGHVPPQITLINGAYAEITAENGSGTVLQHFV
ncbi:Microcin C7 self-immunity protein MccF [Paenibacillus konkukensis]|uniref:Microcin C7 self-immunity protein MccF n=1 Tax=Paenibacillus konkukensis TaxID=2020716 RepID=A0ABY4RYT3_9BACL|nr:S66 peptidase family protein [Paenibacillus konkukensis]UQZ87477.1 Microcin C7 self-immunity protein MccF [Paenibacillus konkukensis]